MVGSRWIPPGIPVVVAGHRISAGLVYYGHPLRAGGGPGGGPAGEAGMDPALIDPELPAGTIPGRYDTTDPGPRPAYHRLTPDHRARYLHWLAGGRRDQDAPAWLVGLFLAGLERRVLVDTGHDPDARRDLPAIAAELRRLRDRHPGCADLLDVVELLAAPRPRRTGSVALPPPPGQGAQRAPVPLALRVALARSAVTGTPVPADWALCWVWHHPQLGRRSPQRRCPTEYRRLFSLRYAHRFGGGLVPVAGDTPIRIPYRPVNPGLKPVVVERPDLPDVLLSAATTQRLGDVLDEVTAALTPYARWLAANPDARDSLAATALLPPDLVDPGSGPLRHLVTWATAHLDGRPRAVVDTAEFRAFWSTSDPARMSRPEAEGLAAVLDRVGLGVEPDVRYGGPCLGAGPAVLFRPGPAGATRVTAVPGGTGHAAVPGGTAYAAVPGGTAYAAVPGGTAYATAAWAVDLAAGLLAARLRDGLDDDRLQDMITGVVAQLGTVTAHSGGPASDASPTGAELARLSARLLWRVVGDPAAAPPRAVRTPAQRAAAGRFLIAVAVHVIGVTPPVVAALTDRYRLLGLEPGLVHSRLIGSADDVRSGRTVPQDPVVVRAAGPVEPGFALPWATGTAAGDTAAGAGCAGVGLDGRVLADRRAQTDDVTTLLATIFADTDTDADTDADADADADAEPAAGPLVAGLDRSYGSLLRELVSRVSWTRADFAVLAGRHGVLPVGAIDVLNEASVEATGEPVVEGDEVLVVNTEAVRELIE